MLARKQSLLLNTLAFFAAQNVLADNMTIAEMGSNMTDVDMEIDCTCDAESGFISCTDPEDETACFCEEEDVICVDEVVEVEVTEEGDAPVAAPVEPPVTVTIDEPLPPDTEPLPTISGASSWSSVVALSAAGIAAFALN